MRNRLASVSLGLIAATILSATTSIAGDGATPLKKLTGALHVQVPEAGSIEDALHIRRASGRVELSEKVSRAKLAIDLYRNGKKVDSLSQSAGLGPDQTADEARFSVQVIDLDYLPLGGGKKGHSRILMTLKLGNLTSASSSDVPKDAFGGRMNSFGFQEFGTRSGSATEVPLFHMILATHPDEKGQTGQYGGGTVEEVVRKNKFSDVLVATIVVEPSPGE